MKGCVVLFLSLFVLLVKSAPTELAIGETRINIDQAKLNIQQAAPSFPIDAVVSWLGEDESALRYTLRSLKENALFIRKIHLLARDDASFPTWLNVSASHLAFIQHSEIFSRHEDLPTNNPAAVEANLDGIPGVSEHFIYLQPGMYFGSPTDRRDWFDNTGQPIIYFTESGFYDQGMKQTNKILQQQITASEAETLTTFQPFPHAKPLTKSLITQASSALAGALAATSHHQQQNDKDISLIQATIGLGLHNKQITMSGISKTTAKIVASQSDLIEARATPPKLLLVGIGGFVSTAATSVEKTTTTTTTTTTPTSLLVEKKPVAGEGSHEEVPNTTGLFNLLFPLPCELEREV